MKIAPFEGCYKQQLIRFKYWSALIVQSSISWFSAIEWAIRGHHFQPANTNAITSRNSLAWLRSDKSDQLIRSNMAMLVSFRQHDHLHLLGSVNHPEDTENCDMDPTSLTSQVLFGNSIGSSGKISIWIALNYRNQKSINDLFDWSCISTIWMEPDQEGVQFALNKHETLQGIQRARYQWHLKQGAIEA